MKKKIIIHIILLAFLLSFSNCRKMLKEAIKESIEVSVEKEVKTVSKEIVDNSVKKGIKKKFPKLTRSSIQKLKNKGFFTKGLDNNVVEVYSKENKLLAKIKGNNITAKPGYNNSSMNPFLDMRELLPNSTYKIDNHIYKTDKYGRVIEASSSVFPKSITKKPRSPQRQTKGNYEKNGILDVDDGGHLISNRLGGVSETINIVPQNRKLNRKIWKEKENFVYENRQYIKNYKVKLAYNGKSKRPDKMIMSYEYKGKKIEEVFINENKILEFK